MLKRIASLLGVIALFALHSPVASATSFTRTQLLSFFSGASGPATATNCWPTNGVGSITGTTMRACQVEYLNSVPWIYGDATSVVFDGTHTAWNWNWPATAGSAGQCLQSGGGGAGVMTWGSCGAASIATNSDVWNGTASKLIDAQVAQTSIVPQALTIATATFTPAFGSGINEDITLVHASCPCTIANPTGVYAGLSGNLRIIQSSSGSDTISSWGSHFVFAGGSAPTLSTGANAVDVLPFYCWDTTHCAVTFIGNVH
jgi:hypothetical protein